MKKIVLLLTTIVSVCLMLTSCNGNEPQNEVDRVRLWLEHTDFWVLYKQASCVRTKHMKIDNDTYVDSTRIFEHLYYNDEDFYHRAPAWKFSKRKLQQSQHIDGVFESEADKVSYDLNIDEEGNVCIDVHDDLYGSMQNAPNVLKHECIIKGVGTDSLYVRQEDVLSERFPESPFFGDTSSVQIREFFLCKIDFTEYIDSLEAHEKEMKEKISSIQKKMKGEWYMEKMHVVTDYGKGYAATDGKTHIDSMYVYSNTYPALKINTEHIPAVKEKPSTFRIGTYSNGSATYDITPSSKKYKTDGDQYYSLSLDNNGILYGFFECYLPKMKNDGTYYLESQGLIIYDIDNDSMKTERSEVKEENKVTGGLMTLETVYHTTFTEYWKRQP